MSLRSTYLIVYATMILCVCSDTAGASSFDVEQATRLREPDAKSPQQPVALDPKAADSPTDLQPKLPPNATLEEKALAQIQRCRTPVMSEDYYPIPHDKYYGGSSAPVIQDVLVDRNGNVLSVAPRKVEPDKMPPIGVLVSLDRKGKVMDVSLDAESQQSFRQYPGFRPVSFDAMTAVRKCSPIRNLPAADYDHWKLLHLHLDNTSLLLGNE